MKSRSAAILERWWRLILETYPSDTARFLEQEGDRFLNPVGHTISQELGHVFEEIVRGVESESLRRSLDSILRIRAVQDFRPSEAVAPIFLLKRAVREELDAEIGQQVSVGDLLKFESRVDRVVLLAFDVYMGCKQKIFEIRVNEASKRSALLLDRLSRIYGKQECETDPEDPDVGSRVAR